MPAPDLAIRRAAYADLAAVVALLADDPLGATRETTGPPLPHEYADAFAAIDKDPNHELVVATVNDGKLIGVLQLTFLPYLTYRGGWRALIEGVRVAADHRSSGVGERLFRWAIQRARDRGCHLVQLTSDKARPDAIRFYERLGFVASHEGMKLHLDRTVPSGTASTRAAAPPGPRTAAKTAIAIVPYDDAWPAEYDVLVRRLQVALGSLAVRVDHVGSTAVPGQPAKDVIDIQVSVASLNEDVQDRLGRSGFERVPDITEDHVPPLSDPTVRAWRKLLFVAPAGERRANVHVREHGSPNQRYALLFRDYLRANPPVAAAYAELKRRLSGSLADAGAYPLVKDPAVDIIYLAAEAWARTVRWEMP